MRTMHQNLAQAAGFGESRETREIGRTRSPRGLILLVGNLEREPELLL
jgi:hypothetical protein